MKTNYLFCAIIAIVALTGCSNEDENEKIPSEAFSDLLFEKYIIQNFDSDNDGLISITESKAVKEINCSNMRITSLKGIQYFTALEKLDCSNNDLKDFDITKNSFLKELFCDACDFGETIDLSNNTLLERLHCSENFNLKTIDLSHNANLLELYCNNNYSMTSLDLSNNKNLQILSCGENPNLESLNVEELTNLKEFYSYNKNHVGLIITGLVGHRLLEKLELNGVKAQAINVKDSPLKVFDCRIDDLYYLDLSGCTHLESLILKGSTLNNNPILSGSSSSSPAASFCSTLDHNPILLDNCSSLKHIEIEEYWLEALDVSSCVSLKTLQCFTDVDITNNTELEEIGVINIINDVKSNKKLKKLSCYTIKNVDIFDFSNQTLLEELALRQIDVDVPLEISKCKALKNLIVHYFMDEAKINTFTITDMPDLEQLYYQHNVSLSIEDCPKLNKVTVGRLTDFNMSNCVMMDFLQCDNGFLKEINIDQCPNITVLDCSNNPISNLSLGALTKLASLYCANCSLTELDLRKNKIIDLLQCQGNPDLIYVYATHTIPNLNHGSATMVYSDD